MRINRLTSDQIQFWQSQTRRNGSIFDFEICNMNDLIVRRRLAYSVVEIDHYEAAESGDIVAKQLCDDARAAMEKDISLLIWRNFN